MTDTVGRWNSKNETKLTVRLPVTPRLKADGVILVMEEDLKGVLVEAQRAWEQVGKGRADECHIVIEVIHTKILTDRT